MFYAFNIKKLKIPALALLAAVSAAILVCAYARRLYPLEHMELIERCAGMYDLQPSYVLAVIHAESKFERQATSRKGAKGLMQIRQATADWLAGELKLNGYSYDRIYEPELNIRLGCYYLDKLRRQYAGDLKLALTAYNAGEGNVSKWLADERYSDDGKILKHIPFKETRDYIVRVNRNKLIYDVRLWFRSKRGK